MQIRRARWRLIIGAVTEVVGIVLAAGSSRRLGRPKQLLAFGDGTLLAHVVADVEASALDRVVVVLGNDDRRRGGVASGGPGRDHHRRVRRRQLRVVAARRARRGRRLRRDRVAARRHARRDAADHRPVRRDRGRSSPTWAAVTSYTDGIGHPFLFSADAFPTLRSLHGDKAVWKIVDRESDDRVARIADRRTAPARRRHVGRLSWRCASASASSPRPRWANERYGDTLSRSSSCRAKGGRMFPSRFDFVAAHSVDEAVTAKAQGGGEARILAGGQSLLPMMKIRLANPEQADRHQQHPGARCHRARQRLPESRRARPARRRRRVRAARSARSRRPRRGSPIRSCATAARSAGASRTAIPKAIGTPCCSRPAPTSSRAARTANGRIAIGDFVQGFFTNALADDEMVTEVRIHVPPPKSGGAYLKLERKVGDYATVAVAAHLELADDGTIAKAGLALDERRAEQPEGRPMPKPRSSATRRATSSSPRPVSSRRRRANRETTFGARPPGSARSSAPSRAERLPTAAAQAQGK